MSRFCHVVLRAAALLAVSALPAAAAVLPACSKPVATASKSRVAIGITQEPDTLWTTVEHGGVMLAPDGTMRVTWPLRDGLFWADGEPVTADDFIFTWNLYMDRRSRSSTGRWRSA